MKLIRLLPLLLMVAAGCRSTPNAANGQGPASTASAQRPGYHHELISEFSDGETKFLHLASTNDPDQ